MHEFFKTIDVEDQGIIIDSMECKTFKAGEFVIQQGEDGSEMYLVDEGELDCSKVFNVVDGDQYLKT